LTLQRIEVPEAWRAALDARRAAGHQVGVVLTMGALHAGHLSLIRRAAADCDVVAVTIYVNPLQFGPTEDLSSYPRRLDDDCRRSAEAGAELVFAPSTDALWLDPPQTRVRVKGLTEVLEGSARPGHFDGVATVVTKLFSLTGPCWAYFGEKDFQQLAIIRRMVADLSLPVAIVGCPTVRDQDGLALSSRNAYLTADERQAAPRLYHALLAGKRAVEEDRVDDPALVAKTMADALAHEPRFDLDYAEAVNPEDLHRPPRIRGEVRLLIAARLGRTRLIDNISATGPNSTEEGRR
jgi:pantoate--beta-alanine ligase